MLEMRAMLDKLNIGSVTPSIASSPTNSVSSVSQTNQQIDIEIEGGPT